MFCDEFNYCTEWTANDQWLFLLFLALVVAWLAFGKGIAAWRPSDLVKSLAIWALVGIFAIAVAVKLWE